MEIKNKQFMIVGCARSGISTAKFISNNGGKAYLTDNKTYEALVKDNYGLEDIKNDNNITLILGEEIKDEYIKNSSYVILSPGVPPWADVVVRAKEFGIDLISEIEFANSFCRGNIVAITGTNGKTTTTTLLGEIFSNGNYETYVGGNIGDAYINYASKGDENSVYVLEISSYQLEMDKDFSPKISIITNITPDHLDRHKSMENYIKVKGNIFMNQKENDYFIANKDDENVVKLAKEAKCKVCYYTLKEDESAKAYLKNNFIILNHNNEKVKLINIDELKLYGMHNVANVMAASLAAYIYGVKIEVIVNTLKSFKAVEHRIEYVDSVNNVDYINDSKGTNPDATITAINSMKKPITLILGGYDKNADFTDVIKLAKEKVKNIVVLGQTRQKILQCAKENGYTNIIEATSFDEAINKCYALAKENECVLLSPACASWDMFDDYEQRGRLFKDFVKNLRK